MHKPALKQRQEGKGRTKQNICAILARMSLGCCTIKVNELCLFHIKKTLCGLKQMQLVCHELACQVCNNNPCTIVFQPRQEANSGLLGSYGWATMSKGLNSAQWIKNHTINVLNYINWNTLFNFKMF